MKKNFLNTLLIVIILLIAILGTFRTYIVMGESDAPTLISGDKVIINRSAFDLTLPFSNLKIVKLGKPERGDMVLCKVKKKDNGHYWLKRIIGLPGDTIELKQNKLYINHVPLKYEFLSQENFQMVDEMLAGDNFARESGLGLQHFISFSNTKGLLANYGPVIVKQDHFFVLGDNRDNSMDSRLFGSVHRNHIYGKYLMILSRNNT
jgi:signal peptidase I